ncbi:alpha/beta hydrolase fold-3 [Metarhizium guizhouense ARSEF 977]|uniref:Alpha/beta hydrolase fold-3 n=1 Tax=Metarhizium guizhouense (strain ARSEF 977) TaxID=1276136 RepID=A0A0B4G568_METGA|nr:alpha/beta hydrolase fold-3 [Metarhizium guizhouense ARSEF 977]
MKLKVTVYPSKPLLTIGELLKLVFKLLLPFPVYMVYNLVCMIPAAILSRMDVRYSFICAIAKTAFLVLGAKEIQKLVPPTRTAYETWIKANARKPAYQGRLCHDVELLDTGRDSALLWLGNRHRAQKVVLYIHGGGYVIPMLPGHLDLCWNNYIAAGANEGVEVAVAMLQYSLAPRGKMPTQLSQVVAGFNRLLSQGFGPQDVFVGGESGGGNLTMQFVGHLLRAHPEVPEVKLLQPLAAVIAISPGLGSNSETRSFQENKYCDMITEDIVRGLAAEFLPDAETEKLDTIDNPWARPLDSDPCFYDRLAEVVREMYFMVGDRELLADHARAMAALVKKQAPNVIVRLHETAGQPHSSILLEATIREVGESTRNMTSWFTGVIRRN